MAESEVLPLLFENKQLECLTPPIAVIEFKQFLGAVSNRLSMARRF